jgi:hypothetical protein
MSDWIEWNGGECPVDDGTMVYVMFKSDDEGSINPEAAHLFRWSHGGGFGDIIAYRLAEPAADVPPVPPHDMVNHPPHYTAGGIECIEAIRAALTPDEFRGHCKANAMKYIWRERYKGGDESIRKAIWYLQEMLK